ncbi:MAG: ATP-binding cassette domain-containing protein [Demequinaceae bacterium]|nr:ATP-binding cassette domain-containing protein [Demequinaceae bacterium]
MAPFDPRLVTRVGPTRPLLLILATLHAASAALVLLQALLLARLLAPVLSPTPLESDGLGALGALVPTSAREVRFGLTLLSAVVVGRAVLAWASERIAHRAGARVVSNLRSRVIGHVGSLGPRWLASGSAPGVNVLVTQGLEGLLPYFTRFLPSLLTAAMVTPLAVVMVTGLDLTSAAIVLVTLPLVPLFMWLVGRLTQTHSERHLASMVRLGSQTLDLIVGLPTLRSLGRSQGPAGRIHGLGEAHRKATMGSLRIAFLSGLVLELLTTLSVALVAVSMGFRLAGGSITIETALAVLVLAPEAYLPLRNIGLHFHASTNGIAAAEAAFALLDIPTPGRRGSEPAPNLAGLTLRLDALSIATPDGSLLAPADLTLEAHPGTVSALVGPNGEGKSTALLVLAGLVYPTSGTVTAVAPDGTTHLLSDDDTNGVEPETWSRQCAWVPQRPDLGPEGRSLSLGQRERLAVGRACESGRAILLLDEPTAHLDGQARQEVISAIRDAALRGAVVVVATHDDELMAAADLVVEARALDRAAGGTRP